MVLTTRMEKTSTGARRRLVLATGAQRRTCNGVSLNSVFSSDMKEFIAVYLGKMAEHTHPRMPEDSDFSDQRHKKNEQARGGLAL